MFYSSLNQDPITNTPPLSYSINNLTVSEKTTHRDLGIIFSVTLQWRPHYDNITAKAYKILGLLHRIFKNSISYEAKKLLYIYITCQILFIVLLTFVAAIFDPGYFAAGKGSMTSNLGYTK